MGHYHSPPPKTSILLSPPLPQTSILLSLALQNHTLQGQIARGRPALPAFMENYLQRFRQFFSFCLSPVFMTVHVQLSRPIIFIFRRLLAQFQGTCRIKYERQRLLCRSRFFRTLPPIHCPPRKLVKQQQKQIHTLSKRRTRRESI